MKTQFSKILLAQVVAVLLALVVLTTITRASLNQGFKSFLKTQETSVLQTLEPVFGEFYQSRGSWDFLRDQPQNWMRIWRLSQPQRGEPRMRRGRLPQESPRADGPPVGAQLLRWMRSPERGMLRDRLYLLDENRSWIAGSKVTVDSIDELEAITVEQQVVGWLGFAPMGNALPPEAERFLRGQVRSTVISFAIALVVAAGLAYLLARNVSRPVRELGDTVGKLSQGKFAARARIRSRDDIGVLAEHVNDLAKTLEKNRTARQRWMADIAHELRTPVAILKGEVEALADGVRPADERLTVSLKEEIDQLSALIDDVQTLAMSDAGALDLQKARLDLAHLVSQAMEPFQSRFAARGIAVELRLEQPFDLVADQTRLRQLLHNLLENSYRYVEQGGHIRLSLARSKGLAQLVLEDSGPGLSPDQIERLFDRFYRAESSRARATGGAGLGLAICKNIAEAHGGTIRAEPSGLGGLKICIDLPA
ncbi:MAG: HAMP domain-containing protein [Xanthomonadales bacterium]|nr:HAMP domain-containing protein [Gammaproteobacteria bacterium]MBT8053014.1 HAMP domain-containing protein [Gammaproteobacteria bacterium]NND57906.1 HAMP domain-containing protein [Xanthomonadales bacterium]NNK50786.1 HAMP domain-containing protein [Xanthomonadales bacterium]